MPLLHHIQCHPQELKLTIEEVRPLQDNPSISVRVGHKFHFKTNDQSSGTATIIVYKVLENGSLGEPTSALFGDAGGQFTLNNNAVWTPKTVLPSALPPGATEARYRIQERNVPIPGPGAPREGMSGTIVVGPSQP